MTWCLAAAAVLSHVAVYVVGVWVGSRERTKLFNRYAKLVAARDETSKMRPERIRELARRTEHE